MSSPFEPPQPGAGGTPAGTGRYLVVRPYSIEGLGNRLVGLAGALWLAQRLQRTVVVDWRRCAFLIDPERNYFTELFYPKPEIVGVPVLYAPSAEAGDDRGNPDQLRLKLFSARAWQGLKDDGTTPTYLVASKVLRLEKIDPQGDPAARDRFLKAFYECLEPRRQISDELEAWWDGHLRGRVVIAVTVASGNGQFDRGGMHEGRVNMRVFDDEERFLRVLGAACEQAALSFPQARRDGYKVFFTTDSSSMAALLSRLPGAITRRSVFPPPGIGRHFADYAALGYSDREAAADVLIDMLLLARCQALIRNKSLFSRYAVTMTDGFGGNVYELESLFAADTAPS